MRVTWKWLREYVALEEPADEIADLLTRQGLEVSACLPASPGFPGVVAGRILSVEPHPEVQGLRVCRVQTGRGTPLILCGAQNVQAGDLVPVALPGTRLPGGRSIAAAVIHGVLSEGMLCSEQELGLSEDHEGIMLLPPDTAVGIGVEAALSLDDHVLEIEITPNRPDWLSVLGIAREIAARKGRPLRVPEIALEEKGPPVETISSVEILAPESCPRYVARVLEGIRIARSPFWLRNRLTLAGVRPISNIVDVTNYVMLELGQPLHAFDLDLLEEERIVVRKAREGERTATLDGVERVLGAADLLICDGRKPVAVAGVMGGQESEIRPETARVLLESAFFEPRGIRRTAKRLGLSTEASYRFEREIDVEGSRRAADRAVQLMSALAGGRLAAGALDVYPVRFRPRKILFEVSRVNRLLGTAISGDEMCRLLGSLEIGVEPAGGETCSASPPSFRPDLQQAEDVAEEVARLHGYDAVPTCLPRAPVGLVRLDRERRADEKIRDVLVGMGFHEVINYSFVGRDRLALLGPSGGLGGGCDPVAVQNPLSETQGVLRTTLLASLLETVARNLRRKNRDLKLFELRRVFLPAAEGPLPVERKSLAGAIVGSRGVPHWSRAAERADLFDLRGVLEQLFSCFGLEGFEWRENSKHSSLHPGCSGDILINTTWIGLAGKIHPAVREAFDIEEEVYLFEVELSGFASSVERSGFFKPINRNPFVQRDVALVLDDDIPWGRVQERIKALADSRVANIELFDLYRGAPVPEGKKSLAFRLTYQDPSRTLTDEEVNRLQETFLRELLPGVQAQLR